MIKYLIFLVSLTIMQQTECTAQQNPINQKTHRIPQLSKDTEKFDIENYGAGTWHRDLPLGTDLSPNNGSLVSPKQAPELTLAEKEKLSPELLDLYDWAIISYIKDTKKETYHLSEGRDMETLDFYSRRVDNDSVLIVEKLFHGNGNIKSKHLRFQHSVEFGAGFKVGIGYEYDENGKFLREVNHDEGFTFGYEELIDYCFKNDILLDIGYKSSKGNSPLITKEIKDGKKVWTINHFKRPNKENMPAMLKIDEVIDAETGEVIEKDVRPFEERPNFDDEFHNHH